MRSVTHEEQQKIWDQEHATPQVLLQMDSSSPSSGVVKFWQWLQDNGKASFPLNGLEMGCGKGRNVIWLAQQGVNMSGFDFSPHAIKIARQRATLSKVVTAHFIVQDATRVWKFPNESFDFAIDCFASTDIESITGREFAISQMKRVVKASGYILVYAMSTDDEFHKQMLKKSPTYEKNAFLHTTNNKFEKIYEKEELLNLYKGLKIVVEERVPKMATFFGKEYECNHHWFVFQK